MGVHNAIKLAMRNANALKSTEFAGCYHCCKIFETKLITEYTDQNETALCPHCQIDAVIPQIEPLTEDYLLSVKKFWLL